MSTPQPLLSRILEWLKRSPLFWTTAVYVPLLMLILAGTLDLFVKDGTFSRFSACASLTMYWLLAYLAAKAVLVARRSWRRVVAVAVIAVLCLLLAEVAVRALHPIGSMATYRLQASTKCHHLTPPDQVMYHGRGKETGEVITVRTNQHGYRTPYSPEAFAAFEQRIVVLGDSYTFGLRVREEATFPHVLEGLLRARLGRDDVAVLNAGTLSYSPFLMRLRLDEILDAYRPHLVILVLDATDIADDHEYMRMAEPDDHGGHYFPADVLPPVLDDKPSPAERSALFRVLYWPLSFAWALFRHPIWMGSSKTNPGIVHGLVIDGHIEDNRFFIYRYPLEKTRVYFEATMSNIDAIASRVASTEGRFVLAIAPRYHHWDPDACPRNWESYAYTNHEPYQFEYFRFFEEQRDRVDYPILNLLPAFKNAGDGPLVFRRDPHWTRRGHAVVAEALASFLMERELVSQSR